MGQVRDNVAEFARADLEFHLVLAKATGNPVIIKVNNVLRSILEVSMENIVSTLGMVDGLHYHRLIIEAIRARDAQVAEGLLQEHVEKTIVRLKAEAGLAVPGATRTGSAPTRASLEERLALHRRLLGSGEAAPAAGRPSGWATSSSRATSRPPFPCWNRTSPYPRRC